jgi:Cu(I)/Ag(I) efflux system membrane fusion protein
MLHDKRLWLACALLAAALLAGYRLGAGTWPAPRALLGKPASHNHAAASASPSTRTVLYWRDPDGKPAYSAAPAKTAAGKPYLPVHDDEEPDFPENVAKKRQAAGQGGTRKILFYRNPMGLPDTSPVPRKDWMGMDYIPVYEGEEDDAGTVKVSLGKVQRSGVRTAVVEHAHLTRPVRAPAIAKPDERTLYTVALRADGFIEKLYANETGRHVKQGEPLFRIYSPDMVKVQVDYRIATAATGVRDERGALQRLRNLQIPEAVLAQLQRTREPVIAFDWPSPVTGVVMQKKAIEGMMMKAGDEMLRLADLSNIWVVAEVAEQDIGLVREGALAKVSFNAFPGQTFEGRVTLILHELDAATRTAKVRIEVANPEHRIRHEMFADVVIDAGAGEAPRLVVPASAVIDSGNRQVVLVDKGEGRYEPRAVKLGLRGDGLIEVTEGVAAGDKVVTTANFLIDAESNLKAALQGFAVEPAGAAKPERKP